VSSTHDFNAWILGSTFLEKLNILHTQLHVDTLDTSTFGQVESKMSAQLLCLFLANAGGARTLRQLLKKENKPSLFFFCAASSCVSYMYVTHEL
jgi:hypothetical protein